MLKLFSHFVLMMYFSLTVSVYHMECKSLIDNRDTNAEAPLINFSDLSLGVRQVFSDASEIFKKVVEKMVANKKILGFNIQ